jgi:type VI secretion system protein ImpK
MTSPASSPFLDDPAPQRAPDAPARGGETFLVGAFREFYGELLRAKRRALAGGWPRGDGSDSEGTGAPGPERPWRDLLTLLERQALAAGRTGGDIGGELYRQGQYVMAALADDTFLHLDWPGRAAWSDNLLEAKLFGTHRAGEVVFTRLEALLRGRDPAYAELARVYLMALALGFEGKLRDLPEGPALLAAYRRALHRFAFRRDPEVVRGGEAVAPQAYAATVASGPGPRLPHFRRWLVAACVLFVLWIAGAHLVWRGLTLGIAPILERILEDSRSLETPGPASQVPASTEDGR